MNESSVVTILVACISAFGAIGASIAGVYAARSHREQRQFRVENTEQHGATMSLIKTIELTTRETRQDVRELRDDVDDLRTDFDSHVASPNPKTRPTTKEALRGKPAKEGAKPVKPRRRAS